MVIIFVLIEALLLCLGINLFPREKFERIANESRVIE